MSVDTRLAGVDIGGTKISVVVSDPDLNVLGRVTKPTSGHDSDGVVERIAELVEEAYPGPVAAVGVAFPGIVKAHTGSVSRAVNLHWDELSLGDLLGARLGAPVWVENDVQAAALGIHQLRLAGAAESLAYLSVGTGIGTGIVIDGRVWRGAHGMAGEIGHVVVDPDGQVCSCGLRGCLETFAAGPAVARRYQDALSSRTDEDRPVRAEDVYQAAVAGDPRALEIVDDAGDHLAWAIHALMMVFGVELVVLGGGLARAGGAFLAPIERGLDRRRAASQLAAEVLGPGTVQLLAADAEPGAWGAVLAARRGLERSRR